MFKLNRFTLVSLTLLGAFLLSACGGALPQFSSPEAGLKVQAKEIVFTGIVEAMNGSEWIVSGQKITVDPAAATDPNITVGVIVKVEGQVSPDGVVTALKVETSTVSDDNANAGNANDNGNSNTNSDNSNTANSNTANDNGNPTDGAESEVFGVVETLTTDSITVNGVTYQLASFTEIKDAIIVGDQVKIHFLVNSDGTFTIREIEKSDILGDDNSNGANSNDGNANNSNDDNNNDDNGNDDNSNDDNNGNGGGDDDNDGNDGNDNGGNGNG